MLLEIIMFLHHDMKCLVENALRTGENMMMLLVTCLGFKAWALGAAILVFFYDSCTKLGVVPADRTHWYITYCHM